MIEFSTDYSGLGSPEEAFKRLKVEHEVVFACEKDEHARRSYLENHKPKIFYDDVTTRNNATAPKSDFYFAGFPCQAFSISGKRLGFEDTRGTLFFNSLEYIAIHKPRVIGFENVKGLLSHDKIPGSKSKYGRTFGVIRDALAATINGQHNLYKYDDCINYHIHFQVLNTKNYGLPQNRERIFIVGFRDEEDSIRFKFPKKIPLQLKLKDLLEKNVPEKYYLSEKALSRLLKRGDNLGEINNISKVITTTNQQSNLSFKNSGTLISDEFELTNSRTRIAKSTDSISPCIMANQAKQSTDSILIHEVDEADKFYEIICNCGYTYKGKLSTVCPECNIIQSATTNEVKTQVIIDNDNGKIRDIGNVSMSLDANYGKGMDNHGQRSMILEDGFDVKVAHRSRTEEAKEIRKKNRQVGNDTNPFAKKEVSFKETDVMNTITASASDDQIILIEHREHIEKDYKVITDGIVPTLRAESHGHETKVVENDSILFIKENTAHGYTEIKPGDSINISNLNSKTRRGRVGDQIANTLDTSCNQAVLLPLFGTENNGRATRIYDENGIAVTQSANGGGLGEKTGLYLTGKRIRRLIPLECFRLQGYSDDFFERCASVNSDTQLYKQAGNSISVDTFMHLLIQILIAIKEPFVWKQ